MFVEKSSGIKSRELEKSTLEDCQQVRMLDLVEKASLELFLAAWSEELRNGSFVNRSLGENHNHDLPNFFRASRHPLGSGYTHHKCYSLVRRINDPFLRIPEEQRNPVEGQEVI